MLLMEFDIDNVGINPHIKYSGDSKGSTGGLWHPVRTQPLQPQRSRPSHPMVIAVTWGGGGGGDGGRGKKEKRAWNAHCVLFFFALSGAAL